MIRKNNIILIVMARIDIIIIILLIISNIFSLEQEKCSLRGWLFNRLFFFFDIELGLSMLSCYSFKTIAYWIGQIVPLLCCTCTTSVSLALDWVFQCHVIFIKIVQGDPKKMSHSVLQLKSVVGVQSYFFRGVSESEFRARSN